MDGTTAVTLYDKFIKNKNYDFNESQVNMMKKILETIDEDKQIKMSNVELTMSIAFIFGYYYDADLIRDILSNYNDPVRAFVSYKNGCKNLDKNNNLMSIEKIPLFLTGILAVFGLFLITISAFYPIIYFDTIRDLVKLTTIDKLIYPIMGIGLIIPIFYLFNIQSYAKTFVKFKKEVIK